MIDLHIHLLPGVDDGARNLAEATEMCRLAERDGCDVLVATPHQRQASWWNDDVEELRSLKDRLQEEVGERPRILLGGEVRVDGALLDALEAPCHSGILSLAGSRYLLVELRRNGIGPRPKELFHELMISGWRPILAHPEFAPEIGGNLPLAAELVDTGALFQVTAMSLTGGFGDGIRQTALALLDAGLVHFVASDGHRIDRRPPGLGQAFREIASRHGEELAHQLTKANPLAVIEDRSLDAETRYPPSGPQGRALAPSSCRA